MRSRKKFGEEIVPAAPTDVMMIPRICKALQEQFKIFSSEATTDMIANNWYQEENVDANNRSLQTNVCARQTLALFSLDEAAGALGEDVIAGSTQNHSSVQANGQQPTSEKNDRTLHHLFKALNVLKHERSALILVNTC